MGAFVHTYTSRSGSVKILCWSDSTIGRAQQTQEELTALHGLLEVPNEGQSVIVSVRNRIS